MSGRSVYVVRSPKLKRAKIGVSVNVQKRMHGIQVGCPEPIELWWEHKPVGRSAMDLEEHLHDLCRPWHTSGEWFQECDTFWLTLDEATGCGVPQDAPQDTNASRYDWFRAKAEEVKDRHTRWKTMARFEDKVNRAVFMDLRDGLSRLCYWLNRIENRDVMPVPEYKHDPYGLGVSDRLWRDLERIGDRLRHAVNDAADVPTSTDGNFWSDPSGLSGAIVGVRHLAELLDDHEWSEKAA